MVSVGLKRGVIQVVSPGKKAGKTSLACKIVSYLKSKGYHVAAVKHVAESIDVKGKDTWRLYESGADVVVAASTGALYRLERRTAGLHEVLAELPPTIMAVVVEGFKSVRGYPKVLVVSPQQQLTLSDIAPILGDLVAVFSWDGRPVLEGVNVRPYSADELGELLKHVEEVLVSQVAEGLRALDLQVQGYSSLRDLAMALMRGEVDVLTLTSAAEAVLKVNGVPIPLSKYPRRVLIELLTAFVRTLKAVPREPLRSIEVRLSVSD